MTGHTQLLSEVLRPQHLADLTLPNPDIERLNRMVASGSIMNMLFFGKSGLGKTSAARAIIKIMDAHVYEINGSEATGIDFVRENIKMFVGTHSLVGKAKICFIDECDYLSKNAQAALRYVIEKYSHNCRFLFTANEIGKMIPAIQSRMLRISFDISVADRAEVQHRLTGRYQAILSERGSRYDETRLRQIVGIYFPDLRAIANRLEYEFA